MNTKPQPAIGLRPVVEQAMAALPVRAYLHPKADRCVTVDPNGYEAPRPLVARSEAVEAVLGLLVTGAAPLARTSEGPTVLDAHRMGAEGGAHSEAERKLFEAYMAGHCWKCGEWVPGLGEFGMYDDIQTRMLFAVWRDRAALAPGRANGGV